MSEEILALTDSAIPENTPPEATPEQLARNAELRELLASVVQAGNSVTWLDVFKQSGVLFLVLLTAGFAVIGWLGDTLEFRVSGLMLGWSIAGLAFVCFLATWFRHIRDQLRMKRRYEAAISIEDVEARRYVVSYFHRCYDDYEPSEISVSQLLGSFFALFILVITVIVADISLGYMWSPLLALLTYLVVTAVQQEKEFRGWVKGLYADADLSLTASDEIEQNYGSERPSVVENRDGLTFARTLCLSLAFVVAGCCLATTGLNQVKANSANYSQAKTIKQLSEMEVPIALGMTATFAHYMFEDKGLQDPAITTITSEVSQRERHAKEALILEEAVARRKMIEGSLPEGASSEAIASAVKAVEEAQEEPADGN